MYVCPECGLAAAAPGYCPADGAPLAERGDDPLLGTLLGQFRVARMLGAGGMGTVYKAVHPDIGSRVAIKVLSHDCARRRDLVERFFAEARAVNVIRHESIVNVLDLAMLPDGRPYIVMEYLDGVSLSAVIDRGPLPLGSLARLAGEVLGGLGAAHAKGIVHRDLKPDNIFVSPQGHAKVLDFGIAKLRPETGASPTPTQTGSLLGTPHYMSPEQAMAQAVDARTDVYAMGVILYEGATGRKPFMAPSLFDLLRQQVEQAPLPPRGYRPDMPPDYEAVILRAMEKRPENRWQSAGALANALAQVTMMLPGEAWIPIGVDSSGAARIGPPSVPTPHGPALAPTVRAATPTPGPLQLSPTPSGAGELHPQGAPRRSRAGLWVGLALVAVAAGGVGVGVAMSGGGDDGGEGTGNRVPATGNGEQETVDGVSAGPGEVADAGAVAVGGGEVHINGRVFINGQPVTPQTLGMPAPSAPSPSASAPSPSASAPSPSASAPSPSASAPSPSPSAPSPSPSAPPTPGPVNTAAFDVTGYIATAQKLARGYFDDVVLVRIDAEGVFPDGRARLKLSDDFSVLYRFVSPSRAKRPRDLPKGVPFKPTCKVYVNVTGNGVDVHPLEGWECDEPLVGKPRCSARDVWQKARLQGATTEEAAADVGYWAGPGGKGRWHLDIEDEFSEWITDDC